MIPWNKLPEDVQKTVLTVLLMSGVSTTASCGVPTICDPAPPPTTAPHSLTPSPSPLIFDPPPPPRTLAPTRTPGPIICDPAPPPARTRTPVAARRFQLRRLQMTSDPTQSGAAVRGTVYDKQNQPLGDIKVTVQRSGTVIDTVTARNGTFAIPVPNPGSYQLIVGGDQSSALALELKLYDVAEVEWVELPTPAQTPLPLAEIRTVDIVWGDGLTFQVDTSWSGARYRWSVTGGTLIDEREGVSWQPPSAPGRYLLQLVADWGYEGLAVDSLVLTVRADGSILIS